MFGFLNAPCSVCDRAAHETYRGFFCGLSTRLSRDYGAWARFLTNRDSTFISILSSSQASAPPTGENLTCCNPFSKEHLLFGVDDHSRYAAAVTLCGLWAKLEDDQEDETPIRQRLAQTAIPLLERSVDRAKAYLGQFGYPVQAVERELTSQAEREASHGDCWETVSQPTATAFGQIFRHAGQPAQAQPLEQAGSALGRLIYMLDAVEDQRQDDAKGRFNPLSVAKRQANEVGDWISEQLGALDLAVERLTTHRHADLIQSILIDGVRESADGTLTASISGEKQRPKRPVNKKERWWERCCDVCPCDCCHCCPTNGSGCATPDCGCGCGDCSCCPCDCA